MKPSILLLLAIALPGCASHPAGGPVPDGPPRPVALATARAETFPVTYRASGTVRGRSTAVLTSKTMGYVRAVRVRAGDTVTAGQPLVELEANDVRASVARARAALDQSNETKSEADSALEAARAASRIAKSSYDRAAALFHDEAIPKQQFDEAEAHWQAAQAQERAAQARVRAVGSRIDEARAGLGEASATLAYAVLAAPFSGRVLDRKIDPGALAAPGTPLLVLSDEGALRVETAVEESRANDVKIGDEADVEIDTLPGPITGRIAEVVPNVEVESRAFLVKLDLPSGAGDLRPGTFARVGFHVGARPRLVVPTRAITAFGALDRVFVVDGSPPRARLRMVTLGMPQGRFTEVLSGLAAGELVVDEPPADLRDGAPVQPAAEVRP